MNYYNENGDTYQYKGLISVYNLAFSEPSWAQHMGIFPTAAHHEA